MTRAPSPRPRAALALALALASPLAPGVLGAAPDARAEPRAPGHQAPVVRAASATAAADAAEERDPEGRRHRLEPGEAHDTHEERAFVAGEPTFMAPIVHQGTWLALDHLGGVGRARVPTRDDAVVTVHRALVEVPILRRRVYVGGAVGVYGASSDAPTTRAGLLPGNVELFGRYAWRVQGRNAVGTGLGVVLPVPGAASNNTRAQDLAVSLSPLDHLRVRPLVLGLRPMFDFRLTSAPFVLQLRQGLDLGFGASRGFEVSGVVAAHLGFELGRGFAATVEAAELVRFDRDVPDRRRNALAFAPTLLFDAGPVTLVLGSSLAIFAPFATDSRDVLGVRVGVHVPLGVD